jgi:hypothetical protein
MNPPVAGDVPEEPNGGGAGGGSAKPGGEGRSGHELGAFFERVTRYLNDGLSAEEVQAFDAELQNDAAKQDLFVQVCLVQSAVSEKLQTQYSIFREPLFREAHGAKDALLPPPGARARRQPANPPARMRLPGWRFWGAAAVIALVAVPVTIHVSSLLIKPPPIDPFSKVTDSNNARWAVGPEAGGVIIPQTELQLTSGWVEITYRSGTKVTIVGPATFISQSPSLLDLHTGRLSAKVADKRFEVLTPEARITDLGTEFGVSMLDRTEFAVFSGKIAAGDRNDRSGKSRQTFTEGDVAAITGGEIVGETRAAWPQLFPRKLPDGVKTLSVADLFSGGEGTMGRRAAALDMGTGVWSYGRGKLLPASAAGDHAYHKVSNIPAIDGCFVPDGRLAVDSAGHEFDFSKTANVSINQMWVGGIIPWLRDDPHRMGTVLGNEDYAQAPHTLVEFHSNKGVTLDLAELQAMHPGIVLGEFHATVGNSSPLMEGGEQVKSKSDIYVLVDGKAEFERRQFTPGDAPVEVRIPIDANSRFLTLAVTDGGDGTQGDWILWGDPEITVDSTGNVR